MENSYLVGQARAHQAVGRAINRGDLPPAKSLQCEDCGARAAEYDHRDYNSPLDVAPVCRACNRQRGPGIPLGCVTYEQGYAHGYVVTADRVRAASFQVVDFGAYEDAPELSPLS